MYGLNEVGTSNSLWASIFYDANDSGYYSDPNSSSRLNSIFVNEGYSYGWWRNYGQQGLYNQDYGNHWRVSSQSSYGTWEMYGYGRNGWWGVNIVDGSGYYNHYMHENGNGGLYIQNLGKWVFYYSRGNNSLGIGSSSTVSGYALRVNDSIYVNSTNYVGGSTYSPIYYDANDSGYYIDPNTTSSDALRIRGGGLFGPNPTWGAYLRVGTNGRVDGWASVMTTNGNLHLDPRNGYGTYLNWYAGGPVYVENQIQATIYYDRNNTGYYGDFNSTSRMYRTNYDYVYSYNWIYAQSEVIAYYSDERLKTKLGNIENALDKISKLNGFYYVNNELANSVGYTDDKTQIGLSAQEVQSVLPEVVTIAPFDTLFDENEKAIGSKSGENYLTVNYDKIVPLLVEGIKEQSDIIKEQQRQIDELKEMIKSLMK